MSICCLSNKCSVLSGTQETLMSKLHYFKEPILSTLKGYGSTITALKSICDETPQDLHIRLLAQGIELNLVEATGEQAESLWLEIMKIISLVLDQDQRKMVRLFLYCYIYVFSFLLVGLYQLAVR